MQNLRNALGRQEEGEQVSMSRMGPSRMYNKSKSAAIWALDPDEAEGEGKEQPKPESRLKGSIQGALAAAFKKDPVFSQMSFYEVLEQIQSQNMAAAELQCLTAIESAAREMQSRAEKALMEFLAAFVVCLIRRIKKLRRKEKKHELQEYDKIVKNNFKKKGAVQFIDEDHPENKGYLQSKEEQLARRPAGGSKDQTGSQNGSSKKNGSSSSTEGKLGKLLSNSKLKEEKREAVGGGEQMEVHEESVSFSSVVSQSMAVRQRRPKDGKKEKEKEKEKEEVGRHKGRKDEGEEEDEAFIFYRPKAGKKK